MNVLHIFAENIPVNEHNENMLSSLDSNLVTIYAIDEVPSTISVSESDINLAKNRKHTETNGLALKLLLKVEARVMPTVNLDIADKLINGQMGVAKHFKYDQHIITTIYI